MKKSRLCKFGFHEKFYDSITYNAGTDEAPVFVMQTTERCSRPGCDYARVVLS